MTQMLDGDPNFLESLSSIRDKSQLSARISSKGALIKETYTIFEAISNGLSVNDLRQMVVEGQLLLHSSYETRRSIWNHINRRYFMFNNEWVVRSLASAFLNRAIIPNLVVLGHMNIHGELKPADGLEPKLHISKEAGAQKILLPIKNQRHLANISKELQNGLEFIHYQSLSDAINKGLRIDSKQKISKAYAPKSTTSTLLIAHHTLQNLETKLRELIENKLKKVAGEEWWNRRIPPDVKENCEDRKHKREASYPWMTKKEYPPICYADFTHYSKIILKGDNWNDAFKDIFNDKAWIKTKLRELEPIRNDLAHNREISEEDAQKLEINSKEILRCISETS